MSDEAVQAIKLLMQMQQLTVEDLAGLLDESGAGLESAVKTVTEFLEDLRPTLTEGTLRGYNTHFRRFENGIARQCVCECDACLAEFEADGTCSCSCTSCERSALDWTAAGARRLRDRAFTRSELEVFATLAQRHSRKKALIGNRRRARRGLSPKPATGQGGREMAVAALKCLFARAEEDALIDRNPAENLDKGDRGKSKRRALTVDELEELLDVVVSSGDDPELDLLITWCELELGARRGGVLALTVGGLSPQRRTALLVEKGRKGPRTREQPLSEALLVELLAHAADRGGPACVPGSESYDPSAPVLYYKDSTAGAPHPLTRRRFDTLHLRVQQKLKWANEMAYTGHAMRHTLGTIVDRLRGAKVAAAVLGHGPRKTTDSYTQASLSEAAEAFATVNGTTHPLAPDREMPR